MTPRSPLRLRSTLHPVVFEVNARVLVRMLSAASPRPVRLDTLPEDILDTWGKNGFDAIWLMGVWKTGDVGRRIAAAHEGLMDEYRAALPDVRPEDIIGSPYAVQSYDVDPALGGKEALKKLRQRLAAKGMGLILDFVPNHTARDHPWIIAHPEYYVQGHQREDEERPMEFFRVSRGRKEYVIAHGRDPYFAPWTDTAQLNYASDRARKAIIAQIKKIATLCDGVRCDMAMLVLKEVFRKTWEGRTAPGGQEEQGEFWQEAIHVVKVAHPHFLFLAESYWNLEWDLQQLGFDYTYDKTLYDRLVHQDARPIHDHLNADLKFQVKSARFIENHDEPPARVAFPSMGLHHAAAVIASTVPGMVLVHEGQLDGRTARLPVQLGRIAPGSPEEATTEFYARLLPLLQQPAFRKGSWSQLAPLPAWANNASHQNILGFWWQEEMGQSHLVVVNYASFNSQCYLHLPVDGFDGSAVGFQDLIGSAVYVRDKGALLLGGMYFDLPPHGFHVFDVKSSKSA